jgi:CRP-like cAMP-binding protein
MRQGPPHVYLTFKDCLKMSNHDPLHYLPRTRVLDFPARCSVYDPSRPPEHLYLVLAGRVKVFCTAADGSETLLRIVLTEGFFGEASLVPSRTSLREAAVVLEAAQIMSWTAEQIHQQVEREPKLGLALFHYFCSNNTVLRDRIVTVAMYKTGVRVALALLQLTDSLGTLSPEGAVRLTGLTHQAIADYVGTSREIVTAEMNRLRRLGFVTYCRRYTDVFAGALREALRQEGAAPDSALRAPGAYQAAG